MRDNDNDALEKCMGSGLHTAEPVSPPPPLLTHDDKRQCVVDRHLKKEAALKSSCNVV